MFMSPRVIPALIAACLPMVVEASDCPRQAATTVALVKPVSISVVYDSKDEAITLATLKVDRVLRGDAPHSTVTVSMEGGRSRDGIL